MTLQQYLTEDPVFPCDTCDKQKSRVWIHLPGGNQTMGWACHWCINPRTSELRAKLAAAEAKLARIREAWKVAGETPSRDVAGVRRAYDALKIAIEAP